MSRSDVLVDADWADAHLGDPHVVIVEVDEDTSAYDKGHIPGAVKIDWKKDLQDPVRRDFVDKTGFEALLSERGISNDDTVLLYGGNNNWFAAYAYWYFRLYGHDQVLLLDGGRKKWELDSRELSTDVPERPRTNYTATEQDRVVVGDAALGQQRLEAGPVHEVTADRILQVLLPVDLDRAGDVALVVGAGVFVYLHDDDVGVTDVGLRPVGVHEDVGSAHVDIPPSPVTPWRTAGLLDSAG
jgi:rhodanese-related sulfurtransferase